MCTVHDRCTEITVEIRHVITLGNSIPSVENPTFLVTRKRHFRAPVSITNLCDVQVLFFMRMSVQWMQKLTLVVCRLLLQLPTPIKKRERSGKTGVVRSGHTNLEDIIIFVSCGRSFRIKVRIAGARDESGEPSRCDREPLL